MPAHTHPDMPETELHVTGETETDFTFSIVIPKARIRQHLRFLEMLIESVADRNEPRDTDHDR